MSHPAPHPLFDGVEPELIAELTRRARRVRYQEGEVVLEEDGPDPSFFVLEQGSVKVLYRSPEGAEVVVKLFRAPAAFGEMECISDIPYLESVVALEVATALVIARATFLELLSRSHRFTLNVLGDLSARLCIAAQNERSLAFHPVETRLANLLSIYVDFYGLPVKDGIKIRIKLTQDDLARSLGVNRRSVTRALKTWADQKLLVKEGTHFVVRDRDALVKMTDPSMLGIGYRTGDRLRR